MFRDDIRDNDVFISAYFRPEELSAIAAGMCFAERCENVNGNDDDDDDESEPSSQPYYIRIACGCVKFQFINSIHIDINNHRSSIAKTKLQDRANSANTHSLNLHRRAQLAHAEIFMVYKYIV